jgi:protein-S-isoprenylcysteine O-methyltransferase Ste14
MTRGELPRRQLVRAVVGFTAYLVLGPALLFLAAGTWDWPIAWLFVAFVLLSTIGSRLIAWRRNPDLLRERAQFTDAEGAQSWDRALVTIVALVGPMIMMVVIGLDYRLDWSPAIPLALRVAGTVFVAAGYALAVWAMVTNEYFSAVARIQRDRGQTVVSEGPYQLVRHPAYAGSVLANLALPFMFGTLWALAPGLLLNLAVGLRTYLEDRLLQEELPGYGAYTKRTRHRLIPGIW